MADRTVCVGRRESVPLNATGQQLEFIKLMSHHGRYSSSGYTTLVVLSRNESRIGTSSQTLVLSVSHYRK
jgi:hypothetical protein